MLFMDRYYYIDFFTKNEIRRESYTIAYGTLLHKSPCEYVPNYEDILAEKQIIIYEKVSDHKESLAKSPWNTFTEPLGDLGNLYFPYESVTLHRCSYETLKP